MSKPKTSNNGFSSKQEVVSITYEEIGLFPRSFSRVLDRFLKQVFADVENLVIQEYRFYRYLFLTTLKCILILLLVPFFVNFLAKTYVVRPLTDYFWNSKQTEIFLNSYQQKRAFSELKDFEEKLYFEILIYPKTAFNTEQHSTKPMLKEEPYSTSNTQREANKKKGGGPASQRRFPTINKVHLKKLIYNRSSFGARRPPPLGSRPASGFLPSRPYLGLGAHEARTPSLPEAELPMGLGHPSAQLWAWATESGSFYWAKPNKTALFIGLSPIKRLPPRWPALESRAAIEASIQEDVGGLLGAAKQPCEEPPRWPALESRAAIEASIQAHSWGSSWAPFYWAKPNKKTRPLFRIISNYTISRVNYNTKQRKSPYFKKVLGAPLSEAAPTSPWAPTLKKKSHQSIVSAGSGLGGLNLRKNTPPSTFFRNGLGARRPPPLGSRPASGFLPSSPPPLGSRPASGFLPSRPPCFQAYEGAANSARTPKQACFLEVADYSARTPALEEKRVALTPKPSAKQPFFKGTKRDGDSKTAPFYSIGAGEEKMNFLIKNLIPNITTEKTNLTTFADEKTETLINTYTYKSSLFVYQTIEADKNIQQRYQEKTIELAQRYNDQSIEAITNFFADLISLLTLFYLLYAFEIQLNITKSFLLEVFFGLDDSKKSLLILLVTDLLVGYHSSNLWELFFSFLFNHYGLPESQTGIFLLVATLPVLLDVLFKYLIFRHLNRSSPATVATYHAMIE